jgi:hypothetical protein
MESLYRQVKDVVKNLSYKTSMINDIEDLKYKISTLDKTAFSTE